MAYIARLVAIAALLAACGARTFVVTWTDGPTPYDVTLLDQSGLVRTVVVADWDPIEPILDGDPVGLESVDARTLRVGWLAGDCEHHAALEFDRTPDGRYRLSRGVGAGCTELRGIVRVMEITFASPVDAESVDVIRSSSGSP